jgi:hypothetical protein
VLSDAFIAVFWTTLSINCPGGYRLIQNQ